MAIYEVAFMLGKTVTQLREEVPLSELQGWFDYFERRPVGWRDDQRTYLLLSAQGVKEKPERLFPSLKAINGQRNAANTLKGSAMHHFLSKATGGDTLPFLQ